MSIAVVIPVFKQSALLFEAIGSLDADELDSCEIVVVDDGCPAIATMLGGLGLAALHPRMHYVRGGNVGLSGARNRGIELVLRCLPGVDALFFLDADNLLSPGSLQKMRRMLEKHPDADWFYPDSAMFGLEQEVDYGGPFSVFIEALVNICDAGSLVRRRVFEQGLRFCEDMRLGFEDWDFWLSAIERGFRGVHFPDAGFRYRKRPESMLAEAERDGAVIRADLKRRHAWTYDLHAMLLLEHADHPRFAVYLRDRGLVRLTSSADAAGEETSWTAWIARFWAAALDKNRHHAGAFLLVTTAAAWQLLQRMGLAAWVLNDLERRLNDSDLAAVKLSDAGGDVLATSAPAAGADPDAVIAAISTRLLRELVQTDDKWLESAAGAKPLPRISVREVALPGWAWVARPAGGMLRMLVEAYAELRSAADAKARLLPGSGTKLGWPDRSELHFRFRERFGGGVLAPLIPGTRPEIAFVMPLVEFAGVERSTLSAARALKRRGYGLTLVVLGSATVRLAAEVWRVFDRIFLRDGREFGLYSGASYLGTGLTRWSLSGDQADELGLLSVFDVVIACQSADLMGLTGSLRRHGVVAATWLHVFDRSQTGRRTGHPHLALAFEHALDLVVTCSEALRDEMYARGIPAEKLVVVPNAPGVEIAPERAAAAQAARRARQAEPLRILYLGRLDPQKGLDRLRDIAAALAELPDAALRVVGKSVVAPGEDAKLGFDFEAPVYEAEALLSLYEWADVLILPSRYEGLPLTILEAMRLGVVPIATRVGAVPEVVGDGVNGFLVSQENCVSETLARIEELKADRPRLRSMSEHATLTMADRSWDRAVAHLDAALLAQLAARERMRARSAVPGPHTQPFPQPETASLADSAMPAGDCYARRISGAREAAPSGSHGREGRAQKLVQGT